VYQEEKYMKTSELHLAFETPGEVKVAMIDYLKWVIRDFWGVLQGRPPHPPETGETRAQTRTSGASSRG
jgi:hypothetical protein